MTQFSNCCEYTFGYLLLGTCEIINIAISKEKSKQNKIVVIDILFHNRILNQVDTMLYRGAPRL